MAFAKLTSKKELPKSAPIETAFLTTSALSNGSASTEWNQVPSGNSTISADFHQKLNSAFLVKVPELPATLNQKQPTPQAPDRITFPLPKEPGSAFYLPFSWLIHTKLRFTSPTSFLWCRHILTGNTTGIFSPTSPPPVLPASSSQPSSPTSPLQPPIAAETYSLAISHLHHQCAYYAYPSSELPCVSLEESHAFYCQKAREWVTACTSIYEQWRCGKCQYFYFIKPGGFTVFFYYTTYDSSEGNRLTYTIASPISKETLPTNATFVELASGTSGQLAVLCGSNLGNIRSKLQEWKVSFESLSEESITASLQEPNMDSVEEKSEPNDLLLFVGHLRVHALFNALLQMTDLAAYTDAFVAVSTIAPRVGKGTDSTLGTTNLAVRKPPPALPTVLAPIPFLNSVRKLPRVKVLGSTVGYIDKIETILHDVEFSGVLLPTAFQALMHIFPSTQIHGFTVRVLGTMGCTLPLASIDADGWDPMIKAKPAEVSNVTSESTSSRKIIISNTLPSLVARIDYKQDSYVAVFCHAASLSSLSQQQQQQRSLQGKDKGISKMTAMSAVIPAAKRTRFTSDL